MKQEMTSRDRQALETREKLIRVTRTLISEMDVADIKISDIAKAAGVSVGTFYLYFSSKDGIVAEELKNNNRILAMAKAPNPDRSVIEQYHEYLDRYYEMMSGDGYHYSKALFETMFKASFDEQATNLYLQREYMLELVRIGVERGELSVNNVTAEQFFDLFGNGIIGAMGIWLFSKGDDAVLKMNMDRMKLLIQILK